MTNNICVLVILGHDIMLQILCFIKIMVELIMYIPNYYKIKITISKPKETKYFPTIYSRSLSW